MYAAHSPRARRAPPGNGAEFPRFETKGKGPETLRQHDEAGSRQYCGVPRKGQPLVNGCTAPGLLVQVPDDRLKSGCLSFEPDSRPDPY